MVDLASLTVKPATAAPPKSGLYRIARSDSTMRFSRITPQDAALEAAGNRFDVVGGGVLYMASDKKGCYSETLARFRMSSQVRSAVESIENGANHMVCGGVPADWRARRVIATLVVEDPLPFLDVEVPDTHTFLTAEMATVLARLGVDALDVSYVRGRNRLVTRAISEWAYHAVDSDQQPLYSGIRYVSKLGDWECWAVFEGSDIRVTDRSVIQVTDPDIMEVANSFNLRIF